MKALLYLLLFSICLLGVVWSLFMMGDYYTNGSNHHMLIFILSFISLGGTVLFGYAFFIHAKELNI